MLGHTNVCLDLSSSIVYCQLSLVDYHAKHGLRKNKDDSRKQRRLFLLCAGYRARYPRFAFYIYVYADLKEHRENIYTSRYIEDYIRLTLMKDIDIRIIS